MDTENTDSKQSVLSLTLISKRVTIFTDRKKKALIKPQGQRRNEKFKNPLCPKRIQFFRQTLISHGTNPLYGEQFKSGQVYPFVIRKENIIRNTVRVFLFSKKNIHIVR